MLLNECRFHKHTTEQNVQRRYLFTALSSKDVQMAPGHVCPDTSERTSVGPILASLLPRLLRRLQHHLLERVFLLEA